MPCFCAVQRHILCAAITHDKFALSWVLKLAQELGTLTRETSGKALRSMVGNSAQKRHAGKPRCLAVKGDRLAAPGPLARQRDHLIRKASAAFSQPIHSYSDVIRGFNHDLACAKQVRTAVQKFATEVAG